MTPGEAAYRKFRELTYEPEEVPVTVSWDELSEHGKGGWEEIAQAAIAVQNFKLHCEEHCICPHCL